MVSQEDSMIRQLAVLAISSLVPLAGCGNGEEECVDEEYSCNGDMLMLCVEGVLEEEEDCAAQEMMCHAEMGHCMAEDTDMPM